MSLLLAVLLVAEGLWTGVTVLSRLPTPVAAGDWETMFVIAVRGCVGVAQFTAGFLLVQNREPGPRLARWALVTSALLVVLEIGFRLAPGNTFPTGRWWLVAAYGLYATAGLAVLARRGRPA